MQKRLGSNWTVTAKGEDPARFRRQRHAPRLSLAEWAEMQGVCIHCEYKAGVRPHGAKCPCRPGGPVITVKREVERTLTARKVAQVQKAAGVFNGIRLTVKGGR